ncbi:hypothetical protein [Paracidobacterium acidisoli]|uniref:Uncharacterized protein n=1 Tax=Paracidobacterium acidisoli TaxID=2303751 RepID=A0A372IPL4_9BACT|nr:hypothetical protein [Paracidobacterium acidisoli]MBT9331133.1 hypothetical protein [Paracidobacterium acidisoli]
MRIARSVLFPLTHWNWKAALLTAVLRGSACIAALRHMELHARQHFGIVEAAYVLLTSGVFSAWQQQSLSIRSRRLGWFTCVFAVPLSSLGLDTLLHLRLDHGNMRALGISALVFTLVSAMFHWHVMQNGAMIVGESSRSLWTDLRQMPRLVLSFIRTPLSWLGTAGDSASEAAECEAELAA